MNKKLRAVEKLIAAALAIVLMSTVIPFAEAQAPAARRKDPITGSHAPHAPPPAPAVKKEPTPEPEPIGPAPTPVNIDSAVTLKFSSKTPPVPAPPVSPKVTPNLPTQEVKLISAGYTNLDMLRFSSSAPLAFLGFSFETKVLLERVDVATGTASPPMSLQDSGFVADVSEDGTTAVTAKGKVLSVWSIADNKPKITARFEPAGADFGKNYGRIYLVGNEHVIVETFDAISLWKIDGAKKIWTAPIGAKMGAAWVIDPTRTLGAYYSRAEDHIFVFDLLTGTPRYQFAAPGVRFMTFSPGGRQIAVSGDYSIVTIYNIQTGDVVTKQFLPFEPGLPPVGPVRLVGDGFAIVATNDKPVVYNLMSGIPLCALADLGGFIGGATLDSGGRMWNYSSKSNVLSWAWPVTDAVRKAAAEANPADYFIVKPGDTVMVKVHLFEAQPGVEDEVRASFEKQLKAAGYIIVKEMQESPIVFAADAPAGMAAQLISVDADNKAVWGQIAYFDPATANPRPEQGKDPFEVERAKRYRALASFSLPTRVPKPISKTIPSVFLFGKK